MTDLKLFFKTYFQEIIFKVLGKDMTKPFNVVKNLSQ